MHIEQPFVFPFFRNLSSSNLLLDSKLVKKIINIVVYNHSIMLFFPLYYYLGLTQLIHLSRYILDVNMLSMLFIIIQ